MPEELTQSMFISDAHRRPAGGRPGTVPRHAARSVYNVRQVGKNVTTHQFGSLRPASELVHKIRQPSGPCVRVGAPATCWRYPGGGGAVHAKVAGH
jgi:hypothetical protein